MSKISCEHNITIGRKVEGGLWCRECGNKIFDVETRECQTCKHFRDIAIPYCAKMLMAVTPTLKVTFKISKGTCFTGIEGRDDEQD